MCILFKTTVNKYEKNTRLNEKIIYSKNSNTYMHSVSKSKKMIRQWLSDLKYSIAKFGKIIMWNGMLTVHFQNFLTDWHVLLTLVYIILFIYFYFFYYTFVVFSVQFHIFFKILFFNVSLQKRETLDILNCIFLDNFIWIFIFLNICFIFYMVIV